MHQALRRLMALVAVATVTAGCGGGDDGGGTAVDAPPPVVMTETKAVRAAALAPSLGEAVLSAAQHAVDATRRYFLPGTPSPSTSTCANGGLQTLTLVDRDGDGVASAGDRISVEAGDCAGPAFIDGMMGTMHIELSAAQGRPANSLRATVHFPTALRVSANAWRAASLTGSVQIEWSSTELQTSLQVNASAADDLQAEVSGALVENIPGTESIRQPDLRRTLHYDQARVVTSMAFRHDSETLAGSVLVTTPQPLRAYLNTFPDEGRIEIAGAAGSKVVLTPHFVTNSPEYQYALDSNGDGQTDYSASLQWIATVNGVLWWDGTSAPPTWNTGGSGTRPFLATDFHARAHLDWTIASASSVRLQFSRPLAGTTAPLLFRFADQGGQAGLVTPDAPTAATAEMHGALVIVRPVAPLRHGRIYALQVSADGTDWYGRVAVQDMLGNSASSDAWEGLYFSTPDNLRAVAVAQAGFLAGPADQLTLDGRGSTGAPRPIVRYQWSQVSGTPLRFGDAAAAQTTVSWGAAPPSGAEQPVVRLTVADAAGDTETMDIPIVSVDPATSARVLYFRSATGDVVGAGATVLLADSLASFLDYSNGGSVQLWAYPSDHMGTYSLSLSGPNGAALGVGAYENATQWGYMNNLPSLSFSSNGRSCSQTLGRFDVLEIQTDGSGMLTRLAVDFEQQCESAGAPALLGSYRLNSSIPIRR